MKTAVRVLLVSAVACLILLPVSVQVNSPAIYPTIIADGTGLYSTTAATWKRCFQGCSRN